MSEKSPRYPQIEAEVKAVLKNLSGRNLDGIDTAATFFDLGFDSLLLTQASQSLRQKFGVKISFRQLLEDLVSIGAVSAYLDANVPADKTFGAPVPQPVGKPKPAATPAPATMFAPAPATKLDPHDGRRDGPDREAAACADGAATRALARRWTCFSVAGVERRDAGRARDA